MGSEDFIVRGKTLAIVGASSSPEKWGCRLYRKLRESFSVYPINPKHERVLGDKCYPNLKSLPGKPDVVITVVPPGVTEKVVKECAMLGIKRVWMQPGSESRQAIRYCSEKGIECVHNACFVVDGLKEEVM